MNKIVKFDFIDVIPLPKGIIFAGNKKMPDGSSKIIFMHYDVISGELTAVTKGSYFLNKFGINFEEIVSQLGDYISCDAVKLSNGTTVILYPTGEMGVFNEKGKLVWTGDIYYNDAPRRDLVYDSGNVWCCVPARKAVAEYSLTLNKFVMRIGGNNNTSFKRPVSLFADDENIFICDSGSNSIRTINKKTFNVSDYMTFDEPVLKYFRILNSQFVILESGIYEL